MDDQPLGVEDAARRGDVGEVFVDVRTLIPQTRLYTDDITSIRIVVGKKGSGKTHILRYIEEEAKRYREVIYSALGDNMLPTKLEPQFASGMDRPHARQRWSKFWRVAIALSIVSRFTSYDAVVAVRRVSSDFLVEHGYFPEKSKTDDWPLTRQTLAQYFEEYFDEEHPFKISKLRRERDPGSLVVLMLDGIHSIGKLDAFLDKIDVSGLESDVASLSRSYRPFHVIIDGVDEVSWRQPRMWLDFQVGLFDAVFFFNDAQRNSNLIIVTIAIRNFVFQAAAESPHVDRVKNLLSLNWSPKSAEAFLNRRLRQIAKGDFVDSEKLTGERPLANWLGFDNIEAIRRKKLERVESYFLRHTRLSPRNIIRLFNVMCRAKNHLSVEGRVFDQEAFRLVVEEIAGDVSALMLRTAAEEIIAFIPEITDRNLSERKTEGVLEWVAKELEYAIASSGSEVLTWSVYQEILLEFGRAVIDVERVEPDRFKACVKTIDDVLWRSNVVAFYGMAGFVPGWIFSWSPQSDVRPKSGGLVGFHSAIISKCYLGVSEHGPVF